MKFFIGYFLILTISSYAIAQVPWQGPCPTIPSVDNFNTTAYSQLVWFEAEKYFFLPEVTGKCISVNFTELLDGSLDTQYRFTESLTGQKFVFSGRTLLLDSSRTNKTGSLEFTFDILNPAYPNLGGLSKTVQFQVVATDYSTYSINWACLSFQMFHFRSLWILSRDPTYPPAVKQQVRAQLISKAIPYEGGILKRTDQNCDTTTSPAG